MPARTQGVRSNSEGSRVSLEKPSRSPLHQASRKLSAPPTWRTSPPLPVGRQLEADAVEPGRVVRGGRRGRHVAEGHDDVGVVGLVVALEGPAARHAQLPQERLIEPRVGETRGPGASRDGLGIVRESEAPGPVQAEPPGTRRIRCPGARSGRGGQPPRSGRAGGGCAWAACPRRISRGFPMHARVEKIDVHASSVTQLTSRIPAGRRRTASAWSGTG